jgi:hypothetical protein
VLLIVILIGVVLGLVEHRQTARHGHLSAYDPGSLPQLQGQFLRKFARQAFELAPDAAQSNLFLGISLAEQGRIKQARVHLERALAINRRDPQLLFIYAQVLYALDEDPKKVQQIRNELKQHFPLDWAAAQPEFESLERERAHSLEKKRS